MKWLAIVLVVGCVEPQTIDQATCPPSSSLTYANFGKRFLDDRCQWCHRSDVTDRHGAPPEIVFDTLDDVHEHLERIYLRAAGPNTTMPPGPDDPPADERAQLAEWLSCGAP